MQPSSQLEGNYSGLLRSFSTSAFCFSNFLIYSQDGQRCIPFVLCRERLLWALVVREGLGDSNILPKNPPLKH